MEHGLRSSTVIRLLLAAAAGGLLIALALAQDPPVVGRASSSASAAPASLPAKPDPQVTRLLQALEGTWSIQEELAPDASAPNGKTGKGTIVWRPGPGGYSVIEEYRTKQGADGVSGLGEMWWDGTAKGYHTIWCDSTNPGGCIDFKNVAHWEDSKLVLQEDYEIKGKKFTFREEFGDIAADSFTQTLYGGPVGGPLKVDQTIHATRVKSSGR